jgi:hypothetical protein
MTLFDAVSKQEIFAEAIAAFCPDGKDRATLAILETNQHYRDGKIRIVKLEELESRDGLGLVRPSLS